MPTYELVVLFKALPKNDLTNALKRTANHIFKEGGIIRKINNLGASATPYRISSHNNFFREAHYFILEFDSPTLSLTSIKDAYRLDKDILRTRIHLPVTPIIPSECTLEEENKPPPFRSEVQEMLRLAERKFRMKKRVQPNTGLDFDPFPS